MFGKLKNKLKNWTKSLSKKAEEEIEETPEIKEKVEKPKKEKKSEKKKTIREEVEEIDKEIESLPELETSETVEEIIETPKIFNPGTQSYETDFEKVKEIEKNLEEKPHKEAKEEPEKKKSIFNKFSLNINKTKISEKDFSEYEEELELLLLENNVALEVAEKIIQELKERVVGKEFLKKEIEGQMNEILKDIIYEVLVEPFNLIKEIKKFRKEKPNTPYSILFCGINGTGKTTSIAKFAKLLQKNKLTSVMAAGDTFRAASIEQLKKHGSNLDINVIAHEYGSDPASVGFDSIKYAEKNNLDVVLIDTAGRMHTEKNLMSQIEKISKVTNPNTKIFVGESTTGNDILEQVNAFNSSIKIDGIILSKADIDEKGGTALSIGYTTEKPILYLGVGQNYEDLEPFDKEKFIEKLGL